MMGVIQCSKCLQNVSQHSNIPLCHLEREISFLYQVKESSFPHIACYWGSLVDKGWAKNILTKITSPSISAHWWSLFCSCWQTASEEKAGRQTCGDTWCCCRTCFQFHQMNPECCLLLWRSKPLTNLTLSCPFCQLSQLDYRDPFLLWPGEQHLKLWFKRQEGVKAAANKHFVIGKWIVMC